MNPKNEQTDEVPKRSSPSCHIEIVQIQLNFKIYKETFIIQNNKTLNNCTYFKFAALTRGDPLPLAGYLLTPIYIFGFVGGLLNLIVLLKMNSHCVWFLATMALSDILYFSFLFIHESNKFEALANNDWFSNFYAKSYPTVLSLQFVHVTSTVVNDFGSFIVMLIINISLIYKLHEERSKYLQRFSSAKTRGAKKGRRSIMKR
uniref:Uncharacterized protein n=1 Tax=Romanomermis culicivorax TaxID=13658 RepID=A0A915HPQ2_ROMCU